MDILWFDLNDADRRTYHNAFTLLRRERKRYVRRLSAGFEKTQTVMAEYLIRKTLAEKLNISMKDVALEWDDKDMPYVADKSFYISISHVDHYVICAIDEYPIGLDVELNKAVDKKYMNRVCTPDEQSYIRYGFGGYQKRFWECWSAKEALFKLTNEGTLLSQSRFALKDDVTLEMLCKDDFVITVAKGKGSK